MMTHLEPSLITQRCADIVAGIVHCMWGVHASTWDAYQHCMVYDCEQRSECSALGS